MVRAKRTTVAASPRAGALACAVCARPPRPRTGLFLGAFFGTDVSNAIGVIFIAALTALAGGLVTFLREIYLATRNLRIGPH